jgi:hypothetical protein
VAICKVAEEDFGYVVSQCNPNNKHAIELLLLLIELVFDCIERSTLNQAWVSTKTEVENMSSCFIQFADEIVYKVKNPIDLFVKESTKPRHRVCRISLRPPSPASRY